MQRASLGLLRQASSTGVAAHVHAVAAENAVDLAATAMHDHPHHVGVQKSGCVLRETERERERERERTTRTTWACRRVGAF
jgi:ABC-type nickel/cobalt efflux system permease component RcnA